MNGHRRLTVALSLFATMLLACPVLVHSEEEPAEKKEAEEEEPIRDNSFLVEEAYNQEPGIVQHYFNMVPAWEHGAQAKRTFDFVFTQEWPVFSQLNQISYSLPLRRLDGTPDRGTDENVRGVGDITLNYRLQLINRDKKPFPLAVAPRCSLIFPSGDAATGLGNGKLGYQFGLPVSYDLDKWGFNFNAGLTRTDGVTAGLDPDQPFIGHTLGGYNLGFSAIYFVKPHFNLLFEAVSVWDESLEHDGRETRECEAVVLPGFRWSPYTKGDTQWVLGCGVPIGVTPAAPDIGIFFYVSFEHRFLRKKSNGESENK
jgi:hypothetical protein